MRAKICAGVLMVVALASCGGGGNGGGPLSKSDYEHRMQTEATRLTDALRETNVTSAKSMREFGERIGNVKDDVEKAADNLDALEPPPDAAADTQTIADVLHRFAAVIDQIQKTAAKNDTAGFQTAVQQLQKELRAAEPAVQDLKRKGYDVGDFGS